MPYGQEVHMAQDEAAAQDNQNKEWTIQQALKNDIIDQHHAEICDILYDPDITRPYSVAIDLMNLVESAPGAALYSRLIQSPHKVLPIFDAILQDIQQDFISANEEGSRSMYLKPRCYARIPYLPAEEVKRRTIPTAKDIGRFLSVSATVIRTGTVKMVEKYKIFQCATCKQSFKVNADVGQYNKVMMPTKCGARTHASIPPCRGFRFKVQPADVNNANNSTSSMADMCQDYQEIKIQEQSNKLAHGTMPRAMIVILTDDLVDQAKSGDDVTITGTVISRWNQDYTNERSDVELALLANHVHIHNEQRLGQAVTEEQLARFREFWVAHEKRPFTGRNKILSSVCPQVYGLYIVKLAVMLVLSGGVQMVDDSGLRVRGEPHLLLVGDPGTGKSQFLKFAAELSARSVVTTGIGSSKAGLTVAAVRDGAEWQLEAGALVLADRGLCCIDEFGGMSQHDKTAIHEAMEQQSISIAKAGIVCKLNTRCSVIAATNPKGRYDPDQPVSINIALASPLLSRFDLVLVLMDTGNEAWDSKISHFILQTQRRPDGESYKRKKNRRRTKRRRRADDDQAAARTDGNEDIEEEEEDCDDDEEPWSIENLKAYLAWIKSSFEPQLTEPAEQVLIAYYQLQRRADLRNAARTTIRLLESLIRLAQAHAKLLAKDFVTLEDSIAVVSLMEATAQGGAALMGGLNPLHSSFPEDAEEEYRRQERVMLTRLGLMALRRQEPQHDPQPAPRQQERESDEVNHVDKDDEAEQLLARERRRNRRPRVVNDDMFSSPDTSFISNAGGEGSRVKREPASSPVTSRYFNPDESVDSIASTIPPVSPAEPRNDGGVSRIETIVNTGEGGNRGNVQGVDVDEEEEEYTPPGGPSYEY